MGYSYYLYCKYNETHIISAFVELVKLSITHKDQGQGL